MQLAILSDIHGNQYGLQAVLNDISSRKNHPVEKILILGDTVGYYYHPEIIYAELSKWPNIMLQGNHERMLLEAMENPEVLNEVTAKYGHGIASAINTLSPEIIQSIAALPPRALITIDGCKICLCHGSPRDVDEYVYPDAKRDVFEACAAAADDADIVLMGHTHYSFVTQIGSKTLASVGSVGQNRQQGGLASWATLNTDNTAITFFHTPYDTRILIQEVTKNDPQLPYLRDVLMRK